MMRQPYGQMISAPRAFTRFTLASGSCERLGTARTVLLVCAIALFGSANTLLASESLAKRLAGSPWLRHTIDDASRGADGVRLADVNRDGHLDITTGWEQGNAIRVCLNPGPTRVAEKWTAFTVGEVRSPEDAVFVDLDGDAMIDVVSACEGRDRTMYIHWAPHDALDYDDETRWTTEAFPATQGKQAWMFTLPLQVDDRHGVDLIVASKSQGAAVGWLQAPETPRKVQDWRYRQLYAAGWIMSLEAADLDKDGDQDIIVSDRKGDNRGVLWLENPGPGNASDAASWNEHRIGATGREVMFLDVADLDSDGQLDVVAAVKPADIVLLRQTSGDERSWSTHSVTLPQTDIGTAKAVRVADIDANGQLDFVFSCEHAKASKSGVVWLSCTSPHREWTTYDISGPDGVKFDLLQTLDLDHDGDLDVVTCEESANLGVFWYENPTK